MEETEEDDAAKKIRRRASQRASALKIKAGKEAALAEADVMKMITIPDLKRKLEEAEGKNSVLESEKRTLVRSVQLHSNSCNIRIFSEWRARDATDPRAGP
jgi:hypothetical protein